MYFGVVARAAIPVASLRSYRPKCSIVPVVYPRSLTSALKCRSCANEQRTIESVCKRTPYRNSSANLRVKRQRSENPKTILHLGQPKRKAAPTVHRERPAEVRRQTPSAEKRGSQGTLGSLCASFGYFFLQGKKYPSGGTREANVPTRPRGSIFLEKTQKRCYNKVLKSRTTGQTGPSSDKRGKNL